MFLGVGRHVVAASIGMFNRLGCARVGIVDGAQVAGYLGSIAGHWSSMRRSWRRDLHQIYGSHKRSTDT